MEFNEPTQKIKTMRCVSSQQEAVQTREIPEKTFLGRILVKVGLRKPRTRFLYDVMAKFHRQHNLRVGDVVTTEKGGDFLFVQVISPWKGLFRPIGLHDECPSMEGEVAVMYRVIFVNKKPKEEPNGLTPLTEGVFEKIAQQTK